jgi:hypothetical protein
MQPADTAHSDAQILKMSEATRQQYNDEWHEAQGMDCACLLGAQNMCESPYSDAAIEVLLFPDTKMVTPIKED